MYGAQLDEDYLKNLFNKTKIAEKPTLATEARRMLHKMV